MPGTAWWTWTPLDDTLSLNGPRPARIVRVITRVPTNVTTNASRRSSNGSCPSSTTFSWNQDPTAGSYR